MSDDLVFKTVPLPIAKRARGKWLSKEDREALVQAHMARVQPKIEHIRREGTQSVQRSRAERQKLAYSKERAKQRAKARLRADAIAAREGT